MKTDQSWIDLENRSAEWINALYRDHIGLAVDSSEIEHYAQSVTSLAEAMAPAYRDQSYAWSLLRNILEDAKLTAIEREIMSLYEKHYTFDDFLLEDQPVTPYTRPKYLRLENDPKKRHELITRVARGHPEVDRVLEKHNTKKKALATEWECTPIDDFLVSEGLNLVQLRKLLVDIASVMRPIFEACFAENREVVLGSNQGEPWEDFITLYLNRWTEYVDRFIPTIDAVKAVLKITNTMGFAVNRIAMDLEDRPRKVPGASAWDIRIPNDVRICVKPVGSAGNIFSLYHEMGHALHFVSIDPNLPYYIRSGNSSGITETFSFWMESIVSDPIYLEELGVSKRASTELIRFGQLVRSTFSTWLSAQALCIIDYWTQGPFTLEEIGECLSRYMKQFMGLSVPANAIRVLPAFARTLKMNTVGYPIAYSRLGHLLRQLETTQRDWWHSTPAVDIVRNYMRDGRKVGFPTSMLDTDPFIRRYVNSQL